MNRNVKFFKWVSKRNFSSSSNLSSYSGPLSGRSSSHSGPLSGPSTVSLANGVSIVTPTSTSSTVSLTTPTSTSSTSIPILENSIPKYELLNHQNVMDSIGAHEKLNHVSITYQEMMKNSLHLGKNMTTIMTISLRRACLSQPIYLNLTITNHSI